MQQYALTDIFLFFPKIPEKLFKHIFLCLLDRASSW